MKQSILRGGPEPRGLLQQQSVIFGILIVAASLVLYFPSLHHPFADFDDPAYVVNNPHISQNADTISWAFTTFYQFNWHPVTWLSHALDVKLYGTEPAGHHATNILLHAANVLLLYLVLLRATGYAGRSAMVAVLFALHPINVESVAWIAERKNLLSMFFFLLGLRAYSWYACAPMEEEETKPRSRAEVKDPEPQLDAIRYAIMALCFALGLMAKPQIITFPFLLLLWDYWPLGRMAGPKTATVHGTLLDPVVPARSFRWLVKEKLPLFALCAASAAVTIAAQRAGGAMASLQRYPLAVRLTNAVVCYVRYLQKAFWPTRLAPLYPHPWQMLPLWQVGLSLLLLLLITAGVFAARSRRYLLVGWLWFLGALAPMSGVLQVGNQAMADRYAYLPFIGLFLMVCWTLAEFADELLVPALVMRSAGALMIVALVLAGDHQLAYWSDNIDLWRHTLAVTRGNYIAYDNLGHTLMQQGHDDEARQNYQAALAVYPDDPYANLALAAYDEQHRDFGEAIARYTRVIALTPVGPARSELLSRSGMVFLATGDTARAHDNFAQAVAMNAENVQGWLGLGAVAEQSGDLQTAIDDYERANSVRPLQVTYLMLAKVLEKKGDVPAAQIARQRAKLLPETATTKQTFSGGILQK